MNVFCWTLLRVKETLERPRPYQVQSVLKGIIPFSLERNVKEIPLNRLKDMLRYRMACHHMPSWDGQFASVVLLCESWMRLTLTHSNKLSLLAVLTCHARAGYCLFHQYHHTSRPTWGFHYLSFHYLLAIISFHYLRGFTYRLHVDAIVWLNPSSLSASPTGPSYVASLHNDSRLIQQVIPWLSIQ